MEDCQITAKTEAADLLNSVFQNHVVLDSLLPYFNLTTIKILQLVNRNLKKTIRRHSKFITQTKILIQSNDGLFSVKAEDFHWKEMKIRTSNWTVDEFGSLLRILSEVKSLSLDHTYCSDIGHGKKLINILNACINIRELKIDGYLLQFTCPDYLRQNMNQLENLKNLSALHLTNIARLDDNFKLLDLKNFYDILELLFSLPQRLTSFTFKGQHNVDYNSSDIEETVVALIEKHRNYLTFLEINYCVWDTQKFTSIQLPNLQQLICTANGSKLKQVAQFIGNQNHLQTLKIYFLEEVAGSPKCLVAPLVHHSASLEMFDLYWKLNSSHSGADEEDENDKNIDGTTNHFAFSCFRNFEKLQEVTIHQGVSFEIYYSTTVQDPRAPPGTILSNLPVSVQKINLSGAAAKNWLGGTSEFQKSLERFVNLTVLELVQCGSVLDNYSLGYIYKNFPQLKEFGFSNCDEVTDCGLTGINNSGNKVYPALNTLSNLTKLRIMDCRKVTTWGIITSISFPILKELTILPHLPPLVDLYLKLLDQNPMLEVMGIPSSLVFDKATETSDPKKVLFHHSIADYPVIVTNDLEKKLKEKSPRLSVYHEDEMTIPDFLPDFYEETRDDDNDSTDDVAEVTDEN